ncbi:MAG TPA: ABC transporter permease, partial [Candidatus Hydrogenedentes bacterium]|nr:ABC transporter permease [Candidatus Hydrogenedentota bacterium]
MTAPGFQGAGWRRMAVDYAGLLAVLAGLTAVFALTADNFLTMQTFRMMANQIPPAIILAAGMTYVLVIGGIDLSVGSLLALSGAALGVAMVQWGWPLFPAMLLCLGVGAACGLANGLVSSLWALPSFIVTLGMLEAARGGAYLATNSQTMYIGASIERVSETHLL